MAYFFLGTCEQCDSIDLSLESGSAFSLRVKGPGEIHLTGNKFIFQNFYSSIFFYSFLLNTFLLFPFFWIYFVGYHNQIAFDHGHEHEHDGDCCAHSYSDSEFSILTKVTQ